MSGSGMGNDRFERLWRRFEEQVAASSLILNEQAVKWLRERLEKSLRPAVEAQLLAMLANLVNLLSDRSPGTVSPAMLREALKNLGWGRSDFPMAPEAAVRGRRGPTRGVTRGPAEPAGGNGDEETKDAEPEPRRRYGGGMPSMTRVPRDRPATYGLPEEVGSAGEPTKGALEDELSPMPWSPRAGFPPEDEGPEEPRRKHTARAKPPQRNAPAADTEAAPETEAALAREPDPPRTAFARLDAPEVAVAGKEFEVAVGLGEKQSPGVVGGPMERPPSSVGPYTLTVQLVAEGCRLREGETWRRELRVTADEPYPAELFHLTPEPQAEPLRARALQALYSVEGQTMGVAVRPLAVARDQVQAAQAAAAPPPPAEPGVDMSVPTKETAPDLEVRVLLDADHPGRLLWTFQTPYAGVDLPDAPLRTDIGDQPREFARALVDKVNKREGQVGLFPFLSGIGRTVADNLPQEGDFDFWQLLRAVAAAKKAKDAAGPPDVLILSQEPYVPWELAAFPAPLLDPAAPPFLAAQANVGRWVLGRRSRPKQPPPTAVEVHSAAVVSGVYNRPGWRRLPEAEAEAAALATDLDAAGQPLAKPLKLKAAKVNAATQEVLDLLGGAAGPPADLLHFAVHGIYDPTGLDEGLMMVDGQALDPLEVKGLDLPNGPFVFLNACQVGSASKILGDYAGMAEAFLSAGAAGVVAPLWSVKDALAREIALDFYAAAEGGACPAAALREARKSFQAAAKPQSATYLAYQFFGHPALKLKFSIP